ncbi:MULTISPECIES: hypothetical protein [Rhizobium/Agrobacterium group]|uniref:HEPN AbiU2-like domain-containing protein n=1 Tax=Agrobacterium vitis TaxID=373 RepID=A0ABD6H5P9_AGRVI|nr:MULTISPECIES: hypothetical protein [Rhizobium/Agrobacterium group]MCF1447011.1 hypothetical protein [Allorhizobium ampelinum]MCF1491908.1 hypothetical protein [Allorhizobium ampelinum]MUO28717.1 hypothetical protein [Agrobacterium vitis]MUO42673.1 hypothetical protein [Agrobacterium vitis]MUP09687.1 hypothetical protein [Agrobacterium vitis]
MGKQADDLLLQRIANWKTAYTDGATGVLAAIEAMLWDHAAFRTAIRIVNLASQRQQAEVPEGDGPLLNQMLFDLLAKGYWSSLLLGVRKLLDPHPLVGPRGVYSLRAILNDVKACRPKLTRRVYVEHLRMCRYDLNLLRQENWEAIRAATGNAIWEGDTALHLSESSHRDFDYLSGVKEADRSEIDLIDPAVLELIETRLAELDRISEHASSHIAHAGNAESRLGKNLEEFNIRDARKVLKALKEIGDLIGLWFTNGEISNLAVYQGNQFEGLDMVLVPSADMPVLDANWDLIDQDIESWRLEPDDLLSGNGSVSG